MACGKLSADGNGAPSVSIEFILCMEMLGGGRRVFTAKGLKGHHPYVKIWILNSLYT